MGRGEVDVMQEETFKEWAVVELMGHQKIAGLVSEANIGSACLLRVDVPETKTHAKFTKFYGGGAIYAMTLVDEETAKMVAESLDPVPLARWEVHEQMRRWRQAQGKPSLIEYERSFQDEDDAGDGDEEHDGGCDDEEYGPEFG
jgi:hypothetical protein